MLLAKLHNPTNLMLTKSDTDGIFLHFDDGEKQAGIRLDCPDLPGSAVMVKWAEQQLGLTKPKLSDIDLSPQGIREAVDDISSKRRESRRKMNMPERIPK